MTTLPESPVQKAPADSIESQVYGIVERYKENIPTPSERYRLAFALYKYMIGEGDEPFTTVKANKLSLRGISEKELAEKLSEDLKTVRK
jgi:hypothetical protein